MACAFPRDRYMRRASASNSAPSFRERQLGRDLYDDALPRRCAVARRTCGSLAAKRTVERARPRNRLCLLRLDSHLRGRNGISNLAGLESDVLSHEERGVYLGGAFLLYDP